MARILGVGIATLDIVNTVQRYPPEDGEVRAIAHRKSRGGNATNSLVVLSQLGHRCAWAGMVAESPDGQYVLDDLARHAVDTQLCRIVRGAMMPTSYVTVSQATGTRTIVHYRDLPEYSFDDFARTDPTDFDWLHFEGRHVPETKRMLQQAQELATGVPRSVEIEKPRTGVESLFQYADVLFFSRHYAQARGYNKGPDFLHAIKPDAPHATLVCAWGTEGAYALSNRGKPYASAAFSPPELVDTLAAGDVFNGAMIHGLLTGQALQETLVAACQLAGKKCGQAGLGNLARCMGGGAPDQ